MWLFARKADADSISTAASSSGTIGPALVREVLLWCLDPDHDIVPYDGPETTAIQRAWDEAEPVPDR